MVEKSTLPVRTAAVIQEILGSAEGGKTFSELSNPEFLAEGTAIADLEAPDRVLIGRRRPAGDCGAGGHLWPVGAERADPRHQPLEQRAEQARRQCVSGAPKELPPSSINGIAALCEATGADVREVARAIGADSRIGEKFLQAGPGFGGSCFQKDILNLVYLCRHYGLEEVAAYWEQVVTLNHWQQQRIARLVIARLFGTVR